MQDHDDCHAECQDMHERCSTFENDGICDFNVPRIAIGYQARGSRDRGRRADQGTQRHQRFLAYRIKLTEAHDVCLVTWC